MIAIETILGELREAQNLITANMNEFEAARSNHNLSETDREIANSRLLNHIEALRTNTETAATLRKLSIIKINP